MSSKQFASGFITNSLYNILNFQYGLLDKEGTLIPFTKGESKVPVLNYTIQIAKYVTGEKKNLWSTAVQKR